MTRSARAAVDRPEPGPRPHALGRHDRQLRRRAPRSPQRARHDGGRRAPARSARRWRSPSTRTRRQVHRPESAPPADHRPRRPARAARRDRPGRDAGRALHARVRGAAARRTSSAATWSRRCTPAVVVVGRDVRFGRDNSGDLRTMVELGGSTGSRSRSIEDVHGGPDPAPALVVHLGPRAARARGRRRGRGDPRPAAPGARASWCTVTPAAASSASRPRTSAPRPRAWCRPTGSTRAGCAASATRSTPPDGYLPVAISIGTNPTFDGVERRVEAHVPDRTDLELYGEEVVLELVEMLRPTVRFDSVAALSRRCTTTSPGPGLGWPAGPWSWVRSSPAGNIGAP